MNDVDPPTDPPKNFSIVIVNYKTPEITKICLELLRQHLGSNGAPIW
ncbi:MAG: glycosyltransferase, partial [Pseudomonas sp.]